MGQLAEGDGRIGVERGGGRTRRGRGSGGQRWPGGHSPVRGRPLRAERSRRRSPWRGQAGVLASWRRGGPPGPASTPNGAPTTGRRDVRASGARAGGRRVSCRLRAIHPVSMRIHQYLRVYRDMYICVYVCRDRSIDRCTVTTVRCRTPAHGTGCIYISTCAVLHALPAGPDVPRYRGMAGRTGDGDPLPTLGTAKPRLGTPPYLT